MTIETVTWMQNVDYPARIDRAVTEALTDEGVLGRGQLTVAPRGAGANMSVDIGPGRAAVDGDDEENQGNYLVRSTSTENRTVSAAPVSNSRFDLVVLQVNDEQAGGGVTNNATLEVIEGVAELVPSVPATPDSAIALARIGPITSTTAAITSGLILDVRPLAGRKATPGTVEFLAGNIVPTGWLLCDGQAVSRVDFPDLFAEIGETYGNGDGASTFNVPNLVGRTMFATGGNIGAPGAVAGVHEVVLVEAQMPAHTHSVPAHSHTQPNHSHTVSAHTHSNNHDHPATTTSSDTHNHSQTYPSTTLNNRNDPGIGGGINLTASNASFLTTSDSHTHTVDVPAFSGSTGSGGGGSTGDAAPSTNQAAATTTGPKGGATAVPILPPHVAVGMAVIRS